MSTERSRRAFELVEAALELSGDRRRAFLEDACAGDSGLRREVESLLDVAPSAPFLDLRAEDRASVPTSGASGSGLAAFVGELFARRPDLERALEAESRSKSTDTGASYGPAAGPSCASLDPPTLEELAAVQRAADRFSQREEVGRGGMGVVYRVWDAALRRSLALKVIEDARRQDAGSRSDAVSRFLREAQVTGQLDHPGVVPLHELGIDAAGRPFFTMRLVAGMDLGEVIRLAKEGKDGWSLTRVAGVLVKVLETLAYAHSKGVIHRDLKPQNIRIGQYGETYVMDWGLAKVVGAEDHRDLRPRDEVDATDDGGPEPGAPAGEPRRPGSASPLLTMDGAVLGTPSFMPPEQASGRAEALDGRSDVYSVGAILYTLITGLPPFAERECSRSPRGVLRALRRGPPRPLHELAPGAPPELIAICDKAMARSPGDRYADAAAMAEDVKSYLENRVVQAYRTGALAELQKWVARNRATAASMAAALVLTVGALGVILALQVKAKNDIALEQASTKAALLEKGQALVRADGLRIIATARAALADDPGLALILAVEGARREPGRLASNALLEALALVRERRTFVAPAASFTAVLSPDGSRLVTGHWDGTAWIRDAETGRPALALVGHEKPVTSTCFSADGSVLLTSSSDGTARLWDATNGSPLRTYSMGGSPVSFARLSADGRRVAAALEDGTARVLDAETGRELAVLRGHGAAVASAMFDARGERVVTASLDGKARVWDAGSGAALITIAVGAPRALSFAAFHPAGDLICTAATDPALLLWDASNGRQRAVLRGHVGAVACVDFSADGRWLLSGGYDNTVRLWDVFRSDEPREAAVFRGHRGRLATVQLGADGRRAISSAGDGTARLWDILPRADASIFAPQPEWPPSRAFSPDGKRVVVPSGEVAKILDVATGETLTTLDGKSGLVYCARFDPSGRSVVTAFLFAARLTIWDAATGAETVRLEGHRDASFWAEFSPDGKRIVSASRDRTARVWDVATAKSLLELRGHTNWLISASFSPDGRRIATSSSDGTARVWDAESGRQLLELKGHSANVRYAGFSADGRTIITTSFDNTARWWDGESGRVLATLAGHYGDVHWAALNADSTMAVTCSRDGTARLWRLPEGVEAATVKAAAGELVQAYFSRDGKWVFAVEVDGTPRAWAVDPLPTAVERMPRELLPGERDAHEIGSVEERRAYRRSWSLKRSREVLELGRRALAARPAEPKVQEYFYSAMDAQVQLLLASRATAEVEEILAGLRRDAEATDDANILAWIAHVEERAGALADAVRTLEMAVREPGSPERVTAQLERCRQRARPDLLTCASIDAALEAADRSTLIPAGELWRFFRGTREPSPDHTWTSASFDDSAWEEGPSGFGYGNEGEATVIGDMPGRYTTLFIRRAFEPPAGLEVDGLVLAVRADDGFVAWLNGEEVARTRAGKKDERLAFDGMATAPAPEPFVPEEIEIPAPLLVTGRNVISLCGLNRTLNNADFLLSPSLACRLKPREERYREAIARVQAPDRRAYAEGALLQRLGRHVEALERLETAAALDGAPPEPWMRIAASLSALGRKEEAASRLGIRLASRPAADRQLWDLWWRLQAVDLARSASKVRALLPPSSTGAGSPGEDLRWLLDELIAGRPLRINAGGGEVEDAGETWSRDRFFRGGRCAAGKPGLAPLHQDARELPTGGLRAPGYSIPLPPGRYAVTIHCADFDPGAAGWRIFDLRLEGRTVLEAYQPGAIQRAVARSLGSLAALPPVVEPRRFELHVTDGFLDLELAPVGAPAAVSAIEVEALR